MKASRAGSRALDAAGIIDPKLRTSYLTCRRLLAEHGRTYHLATMLLPPATRPHIQALYGFARYTDEMADRVDVDRARRAELLVPWTTQVLADLRAGRSDDVVCRALVHTAGTFDIPLERFEVFLATMRSDLTVREYQTYADLKRYTHGAAGVIGLQMTPVLGPDTAALRASMHSVGVAFQLSNILRDVGEDLDRGRVYLPVEDLHRFAVSRTDLEKRVVTEPIRDLLRFQVSRARAVYAHAHTAVPLLHPSSRECIRTALVLYGEILDTIEAADYQVLTERARVGRARRLRVAVPAYLRARRSRRARERSPTLGGVE